MPLQLAVIGAGGAAYGLNYLLISRLFGAASWQRLAVEHARSILGLERALHVANERSWFLLAQDQRLIGLGADGIYLWLHLPLIVLLAVWLYARHRPTFVLLRDAMIAAGLIALVCEYYPVAPPHLVPELGVSNLAAARLYDVVEPKGAFDVYGAVPSIHVGWAVLMGIAFWWHTPRPFGAIAGVLLPLAMAFAVVASGNHYQFDSLTGVAVAMLGLRFACWRRALAASHVPGGATAAASARQSAPGAMRSHDSVSPTPPDD